MAAAHHTAASGLQITMATRLQYGAAKVSCCCPDARPAHRLMRVESARVGQHRSPMSLQRSRRRQLRPLAAADEVSMHANFDTSGLQHRNVATLCEIAEAVK